MQQPSYKQHKKWCGYLEGLKRKIVNVLGEDQFGLRMGKETTDATGILRISK
jgi:hypothetical protein